MRAAAGLDFTELEEAPAEELPNPPGPGEDEEDDEDDGMMVINRVVRPSIPFLTQRPRHHTTSTLLPCEPFRLMRGGCIGSASLGETCVVAAAAHGPAMRRRA